MIRCSFQPHNLGHNIADIVAQLCTEENIYLIWHIINCSMLFLSADHQTKDWPQPIRQRIPRLWQKQVKCCPFPPNMSICPVTLDLRFHFWSFHCEVESKVDSIVLSTIKHSTEKYPADIYCVNGWGNIRLGGGLERSSGFIWDRSKKPN